MILQQVNYDVNSPIGAVQACLRAKQQAVLQIAGIGPASCCSFISYVTPDGRIDNIFGNSRIRIPFQLTRGPIIEVRTACVHGELTALWNILQDENAVPQILDMYIEMSPCANCTLALNNLLPAGQIVYYSFDHPGQVAAWEAAAAALCA